MRFRNEMWFVIPAYKAGDKLARCLRSVMRQKGPWKAVVAVDADDRETAEFAWGVQDPERVRVMVQPERVYALRNAVDAVRRHVPEGAVVAVLDGDDELVGDDVVEAMLAPYEDPDVGAAWSRYVEYQDGKPFDHGSRTSGPMRDDVSPYRQPWRCSPLRTFRRSVFARVDKRNFLDADGEWLRRAYDQALMLPVIHLSRKTAFVDKETYVYHNEPKPEMSRLGEECCDYLRRRRFVGYPMDDVAAGVLTYREGPFLEYVLRWLVGMVSKVIVLEDETSMFGDQGGGDETRRAVEEVMRGVPRAREAIDFRVESFGSGKGPEQEALRRNRVAELAASCGCDWVWHVDADEVYEDDEAKAMWEWLRARMDGKTCLATCPMLTYWRSLHWRVEPPEPHEPVVVSRVDVPAVLARQFCEGPTARVPPEVCRMRHYSWARTPGDVARKIAGWGHADQMRDGWFEDVFMRWRPGCGMTNLHPTQPEAYASVARCPEPLPAALEGHPWSGLDIVADAPGKRVKAVILHHNMPENADGLFSQLAAAFDDVEVIDCGSDPDKIPTRLTVPLPNVYWEGAWLEAMRRWSDHDAIWIVGGDIELRSRPGDYRRAIEDALPFGCWSPAIDGRAHPFMLARHYGGERRRVVNVEGMALAVSGELVRMIGGRFEVETKVGFGQDYWLCAMARDGGLPNYVDGAVEVRHPPGIGYDEADAHRRMDEAFGARFGPDYRRTLFRYKEDFEGNLFKEAQDMGEKKLTIAGVENGWGVKEFMRIVSEFPECRVVIMRKGVSDFTSEASGAEVVEYDPDMKEVLKADVALFPRVGAANRNEFARVFSAGIPVVANVNHHDNLIEHEVDGFVYGNESWAKGWLRRLVDEEGLRLRIGGKAAKKAEALRQEGEGRKEEGPRPAGAASPAAARAEPRDCVVTVITPTFRRDPRVVSRCLDCVRLQTLADVEQLVCSDGAPEPQIASLVGGLGDARVTYHHTIGKKPGDYGNTVRSEMLARAAGEFVFFFDDDNLILPHYLERMVGAIRESGKDFAVCRVVHFGPLNPDAVGSPPQVLRGDPVKLHHVDTLQVVARTEAMREVGWDTEHGYLADGHTLQALGEKFEHVEVPEVLGFHM